MRIRVSFHPFLFAIAPVLFLYSHNVNHVPLFEIFKPLGIMAAVGAALTLIAWLMPWPRRAAMLISLLLIYFFSYGHCAALLGTISGQPGLTPRADLWLAIGWTTLFFTAGFGILRASAMRQQLTRFFNIVSATLVGFSIAASSTYSCDNASNYTSGGLQDQTDSLLQYAQADTLRDIYFIILDRYPSTRNLEEMYNFDNTTFITQLHDAGFYIAEQSHANYLKTALSLAATLNMTPINHLEEHLGESDDWRPLYTMLEDYRAWRFLKRMGYTFYHFGGWWEPTSKNRYADMNYNIYPMREFMMTFFQTTILYPFSRETPDVKTFLNFKQRKLHYERILYEFETLATIPNDKNPTFVFAHLLIPHDPYVFDSTGAYTCRETVLERSEEQNFLNQVLFANRKVIELVTRLQEKSKTAPIIIIQSDEGPFPARYKKNEDTFPWPEASVPELQQKMRILNALYLPDTSSITPYASISPINTFRLILNRYFNTELPLLPDRSYIFRDGKHPYTFIDVTEKMFPKKKVPRKKN